MIRLGLVVVLMLVAWFVIPKESHVPWLFVVGAVMLTPSLLSNILSLRVGRWVDAWAKRENIIVKSYQLEVITKGPMTWTTSDCQRVLRFTAISPAEPGSPAGPSKQPSKRPTLRQGWLCVGDWHLGLLWPRVRVMWDPPASPPNQDPTSQPARREYEPG